MTTDTNNPAPIAEPASEDCIDTALSTMQTALRAAWEGDYTKSARYVELTATRLEARGQHNQAKWLRIALEEMQGKRQPVVVYAMSAPAPAVDERTADSDSGHLAAASNGSPGGAWVPVTERMPASGVTVLACYTNSAGNVGTTRQSYRQGDKIRPVR